jgi:MFS family permease
MSGRRAPLLHPAAVLPGITLLTLGVGYVAVTSQSALYARAVGIGSSSALFATFAVTILAVRLVAGRLADRLGPVRVMFPGMAALAAGCSLWSLIHTPAIALLGAAWIGTGWALVFPALTAWLAARVPDDERGSAIGSMVAFMDVGQGLGGYLVGAVADAAGFGWAFALPAVLALGGAGVLAVAVRRSPDEVSPLEVEPLEAMP